VCYFALEQVGLRALRRNSSSDLMSPCSFPQRDPTSYFFSRKKSRHNYGIQYGREGGGGGEGGGVDRTNLNIPWHRTVQYCTVLFRTVQYCSVLYRNTFLRLRQLHANLLVYITRQADMRSASSTCTLWEHEGRKQVIADSMAFSRHTFFF